MVADDFTAEQPVEVLLQEREVVGQGFKTLVGNQADFAVFQRKRAADMTVGTDRVAPHDVAWHPEVGDKSLAFYIGKASLEAPEANCIEVLQRIVGLIQATAFVDPYPLADQFAEAVIALPGQAFRQTQSTDTAIDAGCFAGK
ncbi:hypothetical protein D3C80_1162540 [compost metagenome]